MASKGKHENSPTHILPGEESHRGRQAAKTDDMITAVRRSVIGRLVIVDGPGTGAIFDLYEGSNSLGRDAKGNVVALDFGDTAIHRHEHAFVTYSKGVSQIHDNGKPNPLKVNGKVLVGEQVLQPNELIIIGKTTLRFEKA